MADRILILFTMLCIVCTCSSNNAGDYCDTAEGNAGQCIDINNCDMQRPLVCSKDTTKGTIYVCCALADILKTPIHVESKPPSLRVRGCGRRTLQVSPRQRATQEVSSELRVIGDEHADKYSTLYSWPWMAGLYVKQKEAPPKIRCGASLINSNYLLTAAHCTQDLRAGQLTVRLGSNFASEGVSYDVSEIKVHPEYEKRNFYNNIALLKVNSTLDYVPVCLPSPGMHRSAFGNRTGTILGWGLTSYDSDLSNALKQVQVPVIPNNTCKKVYKDKRVNITENMLCAGEEGKDACAGDGGGPLMLQSRGGKWIVIGLVSFGVGCGESEYPGVYTRVPKYLKWLSENTNISPRRKPY